MSEIYPDDVLLDSLRERCVGRKVKLSRHRKFRTCKAITGEGDLDESFALRIEFDDGTFADASIYDKITMRDA